MSSRTSRCRKPASPSVASCIRLANSLVTGCSELRIAEAKSGKAISSMYVPGRSRSALIRAQRAVASRPMPCRHSSIRPALRAAVAGDGWSREAAREREADAVTQAEAGTVPLERGGEASVEPAEGAHGDIQAHQRRVDVLGGDPVLSCLLHDLRVVDGAHGRAVRGYGSRDDVPAGLTVKKGEQR